MNTTAHECPDVALADTRQL